MKQKKERKYNLAVIVVFITLVEGLAIYINMIAHPDLQPILTAIIVILVATVSGLVVWYITKVKILVINQKEY